MRRAARASRAGAYWDPRPSPREVLPIVALTAFTWNAYSMSEVPREARVPPASDPRRRHPESDRSETYSRPARRTCQYCMKKEEDGLPMRRCAACKVDLYCVSHLPSCISVDARSPRAVLTGLC